MIVTKFMFVMQWRLHINVIILYKENGFVLFSWSLLHQRYFKWKKKSRGIISCNQWGECSPIVQMKAGIWAAFSVTAQHIEKIC